MVNGALESAPEKREKAETVEPTLEDEEMSAGDDETMWLDLLPDDGGPKPDGRAIRELTKPTEKRVRLAMALMARGLWNDEVSMATGMTTAFVQRVRVRSPNAQRWWPVIDAWRAEHPWAKWPMK